MDTFDCRLNSAVAIGVTSDGEGYPVRYGAPEPYPEFDLHEGLVEVSGHNPVFALVRQLFHDLGLDEGNFGTSAWNPLGALVKEHATILLKPNWVLHASLHGTECLVTHPSLIHAVLPYVLLAKPSRVIIGDSPLQYCDFNVLQKQYDFTRYLHAELGCPFEVKDFRRTVSTITESYWHVKEGCKPLDDYLEVNVGAQSLLEPIAGDWKKFRVTVYDPRFMLKHHKPGYHKYLIARDILHADLVVNLPKLKTHQKAGITCCLKNLIGINGNKEYLPHHRKGGSQNGGDAYCGKSLLLGIMEQVWDIANRNRNNSIIFNTLVKLAFKIKRLNELTGGDGRAEGSWYGNDTVWRTCLDLNRVLLYASTEGAFSKTPVRSVLHIVDAIVAGQGDGPLNPDPLQANMILGGLNPVAVDWVAAVMLGLDPHNIPTILNAFNDFEYPLTMFNPSEIRLSHNGSYRDLNEFAKTYGKKAKPADGWLNHIEQ
jgi:uncharacterized protein (DUF362 family)